MLLCHQAEVFPPSLPLSPLFLPLTLFSLPLQLYWSLPLSPAFVFFQTTGFLFQLYLFPLPWNYAPAVCHWHEGSLHFFFNFLVCVKHSLVLACYGIPNVSVHTVCACVCEQFYINAQLVCTRHPITTHLCTHTLGQCPDSLLYF